VEEEARRMYSDRCYPCQRPHLVHHRPPSQFPASNCLWTLLLIHCDVGVVAGNENGSEGENEAGERCWV
jgi:hypothetical protein